MTEQIPPKSKLDDYFVKPFSDELPSTLYHARRSLLFFSVLLLGAVWLYWYCPNEVLKLIGSENIKLDDPLSHNPLSISLRYICILIYFVVIYYLCYFYYQSRQYSFENHLRVTGTAITIPEGTLADLVGTEHNPNDPSLSDLRLDDCKDQRQATLFCWINKLSNAENDVISYVTSSLDKIIEFSRIEESNENEKKNILNNISSSCHSAKNAINDIKELLGQYRCKKSMQQFDRCFEEMKKSQKVKYHLDMHMPLILALPSLYVASLILLFC